MDEEKRVVGADEVPFGLTEDEFEKFCKDCEDVPEEDMETRLLDVVVNSREDAERIVGAVCITAISYRGEAEDTEEIKQLRSKVSEMEEKIKKYVDEHSVKTFSAKNIGCKKCGSSLAKEYLESDICPLCKNDLRAPSTIEGENALRQRLDVMNRQLDELVEKNRVLNGKVYALTLK